AGRSRPYLTITRRADIDPCLRLIGPCRLRPPGSYRMLLASFGHIGTSWPAVSVRLLPGVMKPLAPTRFQAGSTGAPWSRQHVADIGPGGRVGRYEMPKLLGGQVQPDGKSQEVDRLLGIGADDMGAEEAVRTLLDQDLVG